MPHSTGGGSHGGGFHSGGSFHSSGYSGGSHHSSGPTVQKSYFPGASRFVYYRHHRPVYFYSTGRVRYGSDNTFSMIKSLVIGAAAIFFGLFMVYCSSATPSKLALDYEKTEVSVSDYLGVFSDEESDALIGIMEEFQGKTGITPVLYTTGNEDWIVHYSSLENYAYDVYVNNFEDERHWLLVYTADSNQGAGEFSNWYWESMAGDDTSEIIDEKTADSFGSVVQKELTAATRYSTSDAFYDGFQKILPDIMGRRVDGEGVFLGILFAGSGLFTFLRVLTASATAKQQSKAVKMDDATAQVQEDVCEYCKGIYVHGLHTSCPHCGAPIQKAGSA